MTSENEEEQHLINEAKLLLAEKRTYLAMFRTGVAMFGLSLTALGVFVLDSEIMQPFELDYSVLIPIALLVMVAAGGWMVYQSRRKMKHIDTLIHHIEHKNKRIAEILV